MCVGVGVGGSTGSRIGFGVLVVNSLYSAPVSRSKVLSAVGSGVVEVIEFEYV